MKVLPFLKLEEEKNADAYDDGKKKLNTYLIASIVLVVERILRWHSIPFSGVHALYNPLLFVGKNLGI